MSATPFNESFKSSHVEPVCGNDGAHDFPFEEVFDRLDRVQPILSSLSDEVREQVAMALRQLNREIVSGVLGSQNPEVKVGRTHILLTWILSPDAFTGEPVSQTYLAACLGVSPAALSMLSAELSRRYGVRNRFQAHNWRGRNHVNQSEPIEDQRTEAADEST